MDNSEKAKREKRDREVDRNFTRTLKEDEEEEDVAESGRLFVRNLPYTCTEEELKELFAKHGQKRTDKNVFKNAFFLICVTFLKGPLSELHFPIDSLTKKTKGFAFITYMIPENAVAALAQLDGHVFQVTVTYKNICFWFEV